MGLLHAGPRGQLDRVHTTGLGARDGAANFSPNNTVQTRVKPSSKNRGTGMTALRSILERMKSWKLWAVVVVVVAAGAGGYYAFTTWSDSGSEEEAAQTQLVPVTRGDLVNDVSVTGTLTYTTRETITFGQQGFISEVTVLEGDRVSAGDAIAVLDAETVANLEKAIAQARINVRNAEDALEEARNPYTAAQVARAESDVANARLDLQKAEETLSELGVVSADLLVHARIDILKAQDAIETSKENKVTLVTPTFQEVVKAQSKVTASRVALQDAQDELDALLNPTDGDIESANAAVTKARVDLETANEALDALTSVTAVDLAKAQAAVADAQLDLERAQEAVDDATTPATAEDIADYQANIDSAQDSLLTAQFKLQTTERNAAENIQAAMDDLDVAEDDYSALFEKWLGMSVASPVDQSPDTVFAAHGSDLVTIFEGPHIERMQTLFEQGILRDEPETPWNEVVVYSWAVLYPGEILVDCGDLEAGRHRACIGAEFQDTYDLVQELAASLETLQADEAEKIREAQVTVSKAEDTVTQRREALDDYLTEVAESQSTESEIKSKVEALGLAEATLESLKDDLAGLTAEPDPLDIEARRQDVATAEIKLADSLEALASLTGEQDELLLESKNRAIETAEADLLDAETSLAELMQATEFDIELADREIELAQAKLADAEEALTALLEDPDPIDVQVKQTAVRLAIESLAEAQSTLEEYNSVDQLEIDLRQTDVIAARATLDTAIEDLERATLRAPFNGIVVAVNIEAGQQVNANTQAIEIADPSIVEVSGSVDEIDVLFLQVGSQAFVSLEALGNQTLPGTVSSIANTGTSQQGIVTYPVTIRVDSSESGQLPEGLSATAQVIIREQTDSVLIPLQALYGSVQAPTVRVVSGNDIVEREVTLGISDDFWVVVEGGLNEGETISMEVVGSSTAGFGGIGATFRAVGGFGGRRPGGGGGGGAPAGGGGR
ncbi:MAG: efflux RND transporter periplasmic adaptor subunit [Dehalococcoidia bacterium]|nr:efflux RND transporter periplasmic adaptor subunit [Dehalococcoidia bacterium]